MNFQKWKTVHSHHLHKYNLLLLSSNVKQNHAKKKKAELRAAQSIVKTPEPRHWGYTIVTEKELGATSANHWPSRQSWMTHLKSLNGGSGISIDIIYFKSFLWIWRVKKVERLAQGYPTSSRTEPRKELICLESHPVQLSFHWNPSPSRSYGTQIQFASSMSTLKP